MPYKPVWRTPPASLGSSITSSILNRNSTNRKNIILVILSIELMLLAVTLLAVTLLVRLVSSYQSDDIMGQTSGIWSIAIDSHLAQACLSAGNPNEIHRSAPSASVLLVLDSIARKVPAPEQDMPQRNCQIHTTDSESEKFKLYISVEDIIKPKPHPDTHIPAFNSTLKTRHFRQSWRFRRF